MAYIDSSKDFDVRTLVILMNGNDEALQELIERNVERYHRAHTVEYSENLSELESLVAAYHSQLLNKIKMTRDRLQSTMNTEEVSPQEATMVFIDTLKAVERELEHFAIGSVLSSELAEIADETFYIVKNDSLGHLSMFIDQYLSDLSEDSDNYMKKYIFTLIQHGYLFEHGGKQLSLLVFLSFYEAYVNRIVGLTLIQTVKEHKAEIRALLPIDELGVEKILQYAGSVSVPDAKSCYFTEFQKWFKGDISEFVKQFLIKNVEEDYRIPYQKTSLIDKKKLRSEKCLDVPPPPISIPSPQPIGEFFLISDSHYKLM